MNKHSIRPMLSNAGAEGKGEKGGEDLEGAPESVRAAVLGKDAQLRGNRAGGEQTAEEDAESKAPRLPPKRPVNPTKDEIEKHMPLHIPPMWWCTFCRNGHGISNQHRSKADGEDAIGVTISMDYCFLNGDEREKGILPVLILWDDNLKAIWALPVERKGVEEVVVDWTRKKLEEAGYGGTRITLKSDQEPAMLALKAATAGSRKAETAMIDSPVRESKSNGAVERAVRTWRAQFITLKTHLESRLRENIPGGHPIIDWLGVWAAETHNKFKVGASGRTAYELMVGHRVKHFIVGFGEKVHTSWSLG